MRLVVKKYADGGTFAVETTNEGRTVVKTLDGARDVGERISGYIEAICDDTEEGADRLLAALAWLTEEAQRRKMAYAEKERKKKKKPAPSER